MRSQPYVTITCNRCKREHTKLPLTEVALGWDNRFMDEELKERGWTITEDEDICPACAEDEGA